MMLVLIVDSDLRTRATTAAALDRGGEFEIRSAATIVEARHVCLKTRFDAILMDPALEDGDGLALCNELHRLSKQSAIIVLSAATAEWDIVRALERGATDYIRKPARPAELAARIRAQIRAHERCSDTELEVGPYIFRPESRLLIDPSTNLRVPLTPKETAVLAVLCRAGNHSVTRHALWIAVWGPPVTAPTYAVEAHIHRIRNKLESLSPCARLLIEGRGHYRLLGQAEYRARITGISAVLPVREIGNQRTRRHRVSSSRAGSIGERDLDRAVNE